MEKFYSSKYCSTCGGFFKKSFMKEEKKVEENIISYPIFHLEDKIIYQYTCIHCEREKIQKLYEE